MRRAEVSAPKSSLFDLRNDVQALDKSRRCLRALGSWSLPIANRRPSVSKVKPVSLLVIFSAQVLSVTLRDIASCPPSSETRPGWCPRDDTKTSEVGGKLVKALPTLEPCGGSVSQGAARRHSRKHFACSREFRSPCRRGDTRHPGLRPFRTRDRPLAYQPTKAGARQQRHRAAVPSQRELSVGSTALVNVTIRWWLSPQALATRPMTG